MSGHKRLPPWHELFRQEDGREWLIRPIRPEDADPLLATFTLLGPAEIRQRLVPRGAAAFDIEAAHKLCAPNPQQSFVLVAAENQAPGEALVAALVKVTVVPRTRDAEYAVLIGNFISGQGVGRKLLQRAVKWARTKKLDYLYGWVPQSNKAMMELALSFGFRHDVAGSVPGLLRVTLDLNA